MRCSPAPRAHARDRSGFTLIEVMGALVIFTVGVLGALQLSDGLGERLDRAALRTRVVEAVHEQVDSLRSVGYATLSTGSPPPAVTLSGRNYRIDRTVAQYSPLVKRIAVAIEPVSGSGPTHSTASFLATDW